MTRPRLAVLRAVREMPHAGVDAIAAAVRAELASVSTQAVYDCLNVLTRAGLVRRIQPAGSPGRFETRTGDNHHHLVCRSCGAVADVDCVLGTAPCLNAADAVGFLVDEAEVTFWGWCPACRPDAERSEKHEDRSCTSARITAHPRRQP